MKTTKRTFSPNVLNHIYLDFGVGSMDDIEYKKKNNKSLMWIYVHVALCTDAILFVIGVRSEIWENNKGISALQ